MKLLLSIAMFGFLFACNNSKEMTKSNTSQEPLKAELGDVTVDSDPVTVDSIGIDGNIMTIKVTYSGGCKKHWFDLVGSFSVMKSLPPKRTIKLVHIDKEDNCRKVVNETLKFDISELAATKKSGSEIRLVMDGYKGDISYVYP